VGLRMRPRNEKFSTLVGKAGSNVVIAMATTSSPRLWPFLGHAPGTPIVRERS
jgi:hypothetical protein